MNNNELLILDQIKNAPNDTLKKISGSKVSQMASASNNAESNIPNNDQNNLGLGNYAQQNTENNGQNYSNENHSQNQNNNFDNGKYSTNFGNLLNPVTVVEIIDNVLPSLIIILMSFLGVGVKRKEIQATQKQKDALLEPTAALMAHWNIQTTSPLSAFLVSIAAIYGSNAIEVGVIKSFEEKDKAPKPEQAPKTQTNGRGGARQGAGRKSDKIYPAQNDTSFSLSPKINQ